MYIGTSAATARLERAGESAAARATKKAMRERGGKVMEGKFV
jgi:hypothetical protein